MLKNKIAAAARAAAGSSGLQVWERYSRVTIAVSATSRFKHPVVAHLAAPTGTARWHARAASCCSP